MLARASSSVKEEDDEEDDEDDDEDDEDEDVADWVISRRELMIKASISAR